MPSLDSLLLIVLGLLAAVVIFATVARRAGISYPIVLVIAGLISSLIPHVPRIHLPPELVFVIFLPPLLFVSAWNTSWRSLKHNLIPIVALAIGLVIFTAVGVALLAPRLLPGFDWRLGFLLGAIVSPTDALAASSIARRVGLPPNLVDLLEGESLFNDATGLLALEFGLGFVLSGTVPSVGHGAWQLLWLLGGGTGMGLLIGAAVAFLERWVDDGPSEIAISLITAYGSYLAGDAVHASGVISTVVCGLYLSRRSTEIFTPTVRLQLFAAWNALEFVLNGLVFILIGLQLPGVLAGIRGLGPWLLAAYAVGFTAVLIVLRMLWSFPSLRLAVWLRARLLREEYSRPSRRAIFVVGWTGMRGIIALAAADSIPYTLPGGAAFPQRNLILFLTFAVILITLVPQGLSLPLVIKGLGLGSPPEESEQGERRARVHLLGAAIGFLERSRRTEAEGADTRAYDDLLQQYRHRLEALRFVPGADARGSKARVAPPLRELLLGVMQHQRTELLRLRDDGGVTEETYRALSREIDLGETRFTSQRNV